MIVNPNSGSHEQWAALEAACAREQFTYWKTTAEGEGTDLAHRALDAGCERVVAGGGDGTVREVALALLEREAEAALGIIPLGTGNDLARTLGYPLDPRDALAVILMDDVRAIDAVRVESDGDTTFAVNAAAGGFSGQVDEQLTPELKRTWGPLAYLMGAAAALPDLTGYETRLALDDRMEEEVEVYNLIVANGRTVGGGKRVAPEADPSDGLLDVVLVHVAPLLNIAEISARLLAGNYLESPYVELRRARRLRVAARPGMWFNVDGELLTKEPITFEVMPQALRVLVGPDF